MRDSFCRCRSFLSAVVQSAAVEPPPLSSALLRLSQKHSARQGAQQCSNALTCTEKTTKHLKGCVRQSKKLALNRKSMETEKDDYKILFLSRLDRGCSCNKCRKKDYRVRTYYVTGQEHSTHPVLSVCLGHK